MLRSVSLKRLNTTLRRSYRQSGPFNKDSSPVIAGICGRNFIRGYSRRDLSSFSSIHDPTDTLHVVEEGEEGEEGDNTLTDSRSSVRRGKKLRNDVRFLGTVLGQVIKDQKIDVFDKVEKTRSLTKKWREGQGEIAHVGRVSVDIRSSTISYLYCDHLLL